MQSQFLPHVTLFIVILRLPRLAHLPFTLALSSISMSCLISHWSFSFCAPYEYTCYPSSPCSASFMFAKEIVVIRWMGRGSTIACNDIMHGEGKHFDTCSSRLVCIHLTRIFHQTCGCDNFITIDPKRFTFASQPISVFQSPYQDSHRACIVHI